MSSLSFPVIGLVRAFHDTNVLDIKNETQIIDKGSSLVNGTTRLL